MSFPNKEDRLSCWSHRDIYWKCLDEKKSEDLCKNYRTDYEKFCPVQWVIHFDKKRKKILFDRSMNEGFIPSFPDKSKL